MTPCTFPAIFAAFSLSVAILIPGARTSLGAEPAFVPEAVALACDTLQGRGDIISALQHGGDEDNTDDLILENTVEWVPRFNAFAESEEAMTLRSYAEGAMAGQGLFEYPERTCLILEPALAVTQSGLTVFDAGGGIVPGHLLERCSGALCIPDALQAVADKCDFEVYAVPATAPC